MYVSRHPGYKIHVLLQKKNPTPSVPLQPINCFSCYRFITTQLCKEMGGGEQTQWQQSCPASKTLQAMPHSCYSVVNRRQCPIWTIPRSWCTTMCDRERQRYRKGGWVSPCVLCPLPHGCKETSSSGGIICPTLVIQADGELLCICNAIATRLGKNNS